MIMKPVKPISDLYKGMNQDDHRIIEKGKELLLMEVDLISKLRKDQELTQEELANIGAMSPKPKKRPKTPEKFGAGSFF
jgi:DNA-binding transcriptional regulator YiaG